MRECWFAMAGFVVARYRLIVVPQIMTSRIRARRQPHPPRLPRLLSRPFGFFLVDALAAGFYERCFLNCNGYFPPPLLPPPMFPPNTPPNPPYRPPSMPPYTPALPPPPMFPPIEPPSSPPPPPDIPLIAPPKQCDGLLAAIVAINLFSICAFALVVGVRWVAPERSYSEACRVTYLLVALDLTLKVADAALPIVLVATCFVVRAFNSSMVAYIATCRASATSTRRTALRRDGRRHRRHCRPHALPCSKPKLVSVGLGVHGVALEIGR